MTPRSTRATLRKVAEHAGVSLATASLVLSGKGIQHRIAPDTCERVQRAAEQLDYAPNRLVHSLQRGQTQVLSFFNGFRGRDSQDLYMDNLLSAAEVAAGQLGYDLLVNCDYRRPPSETYRHLNGGLVDGVLFFAPAPEDPLTAHLRTSRLRTVLLNARDPQGLLASVQDDVVSGMAQVAHRLAEAGHRRIAVLGEVRSGGRDTFQRVDLLRRFLAERGIELPESYIVTRTGGYREATAQLLALRPRPTAVFCWRDRLAYWTIEAAEELGVRIPEELSVVGYDGLTWPAPTRHTATSVSVDIELLAATAVSLLVDLIEGRAEPGAEMTVPVRFREGTTLAPPLTSTRREQPAAYASKAG